MFSVTSRTHRGKSYHDAVTHILFFISVCHAGIFISWQLHKRNTSQNKLGTNVKLDYSFKSNFLLSPNSMYTADKKIIHEENN